MNGSIHHVRLTFGSLALLALAAGCSRESRPARAARPSPTFESAVPESPAQGSKPGEMGGMPGMRGEHGTAPPSPLPPAAQQPGMEPGGAMAPPSGMGAPPGPEQGMTGPEHGMPGPQGAAPMPMNEPAPAGQAPEPAAMNEREFCEILVHDAKLRVLDADNGATIVMVPAPGSNLDLVREHARKIERAMTPEMGPREAPAVTERCVLFDVARAGARGVVSETPESIRLLVMTTDPSMVKALRKEVRDFVKAHGGMGAGAKPHAPKAPAPKGTNGKK